MMVKGQRAGFRFRLTDCMLSVFLLFCLALSGCDVQGDPPGLVDDSPSVGEEAVSQDKSSHERTLATPSSSAIREERKPRIVAFGDSLTAGFGVSVEQSYPGQLQRIIRDAGYDYEVVNAGVSGETTAGGLRRVEWVLKSRPDIVILELGANDGLRGQPIEESLKNLRAIISRLHDHGVTVVLAGMKMPLNYGEVYTREFEEMYQQLAGDFHIPLIPFFLEGVAAQRGLNQGDGIHPNAEGYTLVAENVWQILEPILREKDGAQT
jgi:acyl-CoA thioesterase I